MRDLLPMGLPCHYRLRSELQSEQSWACRHPKGLTLSKVITFPVSGNREKLGELTHLGKRALSNKVLTQIVQPKKK